MGAFLATQLRVFIDGAYPVKPQSTIILVTIFAQINLRKRMVHQYIKKLPN